LRIANAVSAREKGALSPTRASLFFYTRNRADLPTSAKTLLAAIRKGVVRPEIGQTYALKDSAPAQADLETRKTTGTTLLVLWAGGEIPGAAAARLSAPF
jgi:NADPH2:quinone reductase